MLINLICTLLIHPLGHTDCRGRVNIAPDLTFSPLPNLPLGTPSNCPAPKAQVKRGRVETQTKQVIFPPLSSQRREADRLHAGVFLKEGKLTLSSVSALPLCPEKTKSQTLPSASRVFRCSLFSCSVMSDSVTPWTAACQASLSLTISWSLLKLMSIESMMPSNYLILCCPLLLLPSIFPSIRVFSNEWALHIRWFTNRKRHTSNAL